MTNACCYKIIYGSQIHSKCKVKKKKNKVQGRPMDSNIIESANRKVSDSRIYHMSRFGVVSEKNAHSNGKGY